MKPSNSTVSGMDVDSEAQASIPDVVRMALRVAFGVRLFRRPELRLGGIGRLPGSAASWSPVLGREFNRGAME